MLAFVLRRLLQAVLVMLTVAFIAFMLFQYVGDPVTNILGQDATQQQRLQLRSDLGLDQPFPVQFARFVGNAVRGEFGLSLRQGRKVSSLIAERLPATLELSLLARHAIDLARKFHAIYHRHPILHEEDPALRQVRLAANAIFRRGLESLMTLLGLPVPDRM